MSFLRVPSLSHAETTYTRMWDLQSWKACTAFQNPCSEAPKVESCE